MVIASQMFARAWAAQACVRSCKVHVTCARQVLLSAELSFTDGRFGCMDSCVHLAALRQQGTGCVRVFPASAVWSMPGMVMKKFFLIVLVTRYL